MIMIVEDDINTSTGINIDNPTFKRLARNNIVNQRFNVLIWS